MNGSHPQKAGNLWNALTDELSRHADTMHSLEVMGESLPQHESEATTVDKDVHAPSNTDAVISQLGDLDGRTSMAIETIDTVGRGLIRRLESLHGSILQASSDAISRRGSAAYVAQNQYRLEHLEHGILFGAFARAATTREAEGSQLNLFPPSLPKPWQLPETSRTMLLVHLFGLKTHQSAALSIQGTTLSGASSYRSAPGVLGSPPGTHPRAHHHAGASLSRLPSIAPTRFPPFGASSWFGHLLGGGIDRYPQV